MDHSQRRKKLAAFLFRLGLMLILIASVPAGPKVAAAVPPALYHPIFDPNTTVYVQNPSTGPVIVTAQAYPNTGGALAATMTANLTIPVLGTGKINWSSFSGLGAVTSYSLVVTPVQGSGIQSVALVNQSEGSGDNQGAYLGSAGTIKTSFGAFYQNAEGKTSALVLFNPHGSPITVTLRPFVKSDPTKSEKVLDVLSHEAKTISGADLGFIDGETGWVEASSASSFAGVMVQSGSGLFRVVDPILETAKTAPRLFKAYPDGGGLRTSRLLLLNPTANPIVGVGVSFHDGVTVVPDATSPYDLAPRELKILDLGALPPGKVYSAAVNAGTVLVSEETSFDGTANPAGSFSLPALPVSPSPSFWVPGILRTPAMHSVVSLQNPGPGLATMQLAYIRADGNAGLNLQDAVLAVGATLRLDAYAAASLGNNFEGSLAVTSAGQPVSVVVDEDKTFTTYLPLAVNRSAACIPQDYQTEKYYYYQWDMDAIYADAAWSQCMRGDPAVVVAVVDSGVDLDHPDLVANLLPGLDYVGGGDPNSNPQDGNGHGTHVTGTIAAAINQLGIVGVAPNMKVLPIRVLDSSGKGDTIDLIEGIDYAAKNAQIINISLGGTTSGNMVPESLKLALDGAINTQHRLVVAAAGNIGDLGNAPTFPAAYPPVFAVAAVDNNWSYPHPGFSNTGSYVDISAPGVWILSTYPRQGSYFTAETGYEYMSGTSMAAPHVSGLAALVWSQHPEYTADQVIAAIQTTAIDLGVPGRDDIFGWGVIQVDRALGLSGPGTAAIQPVEPAVGQTPQIPESSRDAEIAPGRVLVKLQDGIGAAALAAQAGELGGLQVEKELTGIQVKVLRVPVGQEWQTVERLRSLPGVVYAEPDYMMSAQ